MFERIRILVFTMVISVFLGNNSAEAAPTTWSIVSSASYLSVFVASRTLTITSSSSFVPGLVGSSLTVTIRALNPGTGSASGVTGWTLGNTQSLSGQFVAETDFASSIKFLNDPLNTIQGIDSGSYQPLPDGSPGAEPGDFGVRFFAGTTVSPVLGTATLNMDVALRQMSYALQSGTISLVGNSFNASEVDFGMATGGRIAFRARDGGGVLGNTFVGMIGSGSLGFPAQLLDNNEYPGKLVGTPNTVAKLTLPIEIYAQIPMDDRGMVVVSTIISGTIVAVAVPEPSTLALAAIGAVAIAVTAARRRTAFVLHRKTSLCNVGFSDLRSNSTFYRAR